MSNTATFTLHIRNIVKKARDMMGWVLRVFQSRKRSLMLTLLKALVISLLEYCCQLWNPWKAKDIQAIEAIQRTFTYKIMKVQHLNYWEDCTNTNSTLQRRSERYIIIYIWKITQHMVPTVDGTMGHKIKTKNTQVMEHCSLFSFQQTGTQHNLKQFETI